VEAKLHRVEPQPPVDLKFSHFVASADGSYAVVAGPSNEVWSTPLCTPPPPHPSDPISLPVLVCSLTGGLESRWHRCYNSRLLTTDVSVCGEVGGRGGIEEFGALMRCREWGA